MSIYKEMMNEAIAENDITKAKTVIQSSLEIEHNLAEFKQLVKLAQAFPNLWEIHDGRKLDTTIDDAELEDAYSVNKNALLTNFSHERVNYLEEILPKLYKQPIPNPTPSPKPKPVSSSASGPKSTSSRTPSSPRPRVTKDGHRDVNNQAIHNIGIAVTAAGVVVAVTGVVAGSVATTVVGGVVAISGGAAIARSPKSK